ncbi:MAG: PBSX family phage terminase large subunit [Christensenellales bacterium]|jgi:phage terminase large subunit
MARIRFNPSLCNDVYVPFLLDDTAMQVFFGGSSSGKSYFLGQRAVLDTLQGRNYLILRNVAKTLRGSVWNEVTKAIANMGLSAWFNVGKSDMTITALNNGAQIMFAGLDDVEKIKSITPANGVLTDIWVEEATEIDYEDYKQLEKRLRGLSRHKKRITLSFNPVYKDHWLFKQFFGGWADDDTAYRDEHLTIIKTTYKDNRFLTPGDIHRLENEGDEYYREVYTYGNWGTLGDVIFRNWRVEDLTEFARGADRLYFGLDFGFSSDPAACVKLHYDRARKRVYVLDEIYERGLTNDMLADLLLPFTGGHYITCDSAEPKSITELRNRGVKALPARKGPDSVNHGIQWLQGHEIVVDTRCQTMRNELQLYQWRKDKDGNSLRVPEDRNNHLIDSVRYAIESESQQKIATTASREGLGI